MVTAEDGRCDIWCARVNASRRATTRQGKRYRATAWAKGKGRLQLVFWEHGPQMTPAALDARQGLEAEAERVYVVRP